MSIHLHSWPFGRTILLVDDDPFLAASRKSVLERRFREVKRAADAADALIRLDEPGFAERLGLVIVALTQPGLAGPNFVDELSARIPDVPILAMGRAGDVAHDYQGRNVNFLPRQTSPETCFPAPATFLRSFERPDRLATARVPQSRPL